jgi:hypothetical protein
LKHHARLEREKIKNFDFFVQALNSGPSPGVLFYQTDDVEHQHDKTQDSQQQRHPHTSMTVFHVAGYLNAVYTE